MTKKTFKEGDVVFAKVKGYPPWPAKVIAAGTGKYPVLFYGTNERRKCRRANCKAQDIFLFEESKEKYGKNSKPAFVKAMNEAMAAIEGGGDSTAAKRGRRSGSDGSEKSVVHGSEEVSDEEEVEVPKKKAKPATKAKKTPAAAKKPPAKRTNKKLPPSDSESEDRPSSKASSKKSVKSTAKAAGRGQRRGAKSVSYVEEDSDDSDGESKSKQVGSDDEPSQSEGDKNEDSASDTDQSDKGSDSEAEAVAKKTKKRPAARRAAAKKKETPVGRKPRAKRAVKRKTLSVSESEGSKESPPHSDNESVNSSSSAAHSSSSSSSSGSSAGSGRSSTQPDHPTEPTAEAAGEKEEKGDEVKDEMVEDMADVDEKAEDKEDGNEGMKGVEDAPDKKDESGGSEELAISKEQVEDITAADEDGSSRDSATNSSVEDEEIIHSSRAHKAVSKHAVLSESDSDEEDKSKKKEKGLEEMLEERQMEHQQLKMKRRQEKMEAKRQRQLQKEKEQEEERRLKEEKKRLHQQKIRTEKKIRELDDIIKRSLAVSTKDVAKCIEAMKELDGLDIVAAMLVKYPAIIDTLKKCRKYKADTAVMSQAESLCNKLRTIAASDKSALTALNKQKSDKLKVKKEEKVAEVKDEVKQEETMIQIENVDTKTSPLPPEDIKQEVKEKQEVEANGSADQMHKSAPETTQEDMDIDNDSCAPGETHSAPGSADVVDSAHIEGSPVNVDAPNSQQTVEDEAASPLPTAGSVADLKAMAREELPSEDALAAGLQALIAKTQQSSAILDQVIRQKKEKRSSGSSRKRRKLDSGLEPSRSSQSQRTQTSSGRSAVTVTKSSSPVKQPEKVAKALNRKSTDLDELDIHDLLGI